MTQQMILARLARVSALAVLATAVVTGCASSDESEQQHAQSQGTISSETTRGQSASADGTAHYKADSDRKAQSAASGNQSMQMAFPTGDKRTSAIMLEKQLPQQIRVNRPFDYQLKVTNLTDQTVNDVVINEQHPDTFTVANAGDAARPAEQGRGMNYNIGALGAGESKTITVSGTATQAGNLSSCTTVSYQPSLCTAFNVINPQIRLSKTGQQQADICEEIIWTYRIANEGTGSEQDVVIEDQLPEGLATVDGNRAIRIDVGTLNAGETREFKAHLKAGRTGQFASAATARTPVDQINSENVSTNVIAPMLAIDLRGPEQEYVGKQVQYQMTVRNEGQAPARNATVRIQGAGDQFAMAPADGNTGGEAQLASGRMSSSDEMSLGTIEPGQSRTYNLMVTPDSPRALNVAASANAVCAEAVTASARTNVIGISALLLEVVDREDPVKVGLDTIYTISVKNQGSAADQNIQLSATLPGEMQYVTGSGPTQIRAEGNRITFEALPQLQPNEVATWEVQVKANNPGNLLFQVDLKSQSMQQNAGETEPTRVY